MASQFELPTFRARVLVTDNLAKRGVDLLREARDSRWMYRTG